MKEEFPRHEHLSGNALLPMEQKNELPAVPERKETAISADDIRYEIEEKLRNAESERQSTIKRVIGKITNEEKTRILEAARDTFADQKFSELCKGEREKTEEERKIVDMVNDATNHILNKYGLNDFDCPPQNVHVISEKGWKHRGKAGVFRSDLQAVGILEDSAKIVFMKKVFHEMVHLKSYGASQITLEQKPREEDYRQGLIVVSRDGKREYFVNLNEAVTEELTKRYASKLFEDPMFEEERKKTENLRIESGDMKNDEDEKFFNEDTFYAEKKVPESVFNPLKKIFGTLPKEEVEPVKFIYKRQRRNLNALIEKLYDRNRHEFSNKDQVFDVFAKAMLSGNILPLGRLIDKTFGKKTFRKIGEMESDLDDQLRYIELL